MTTRTVAIFGLTFTATPCFQQSLIDASAKMLAEGWQITWISLDPLGGSGNPPNGISWLRLGEPFMANCGWRQLFPLAYKLATSLNAIGAAELLPWGSDAQPVATLAASALGLPLRKYDGFKNRRIGKLPPCVNKPVAWRRHFLRLLSFIASPSRARRIYFEQLDKCNLLETIFDFDHYRAQPCPRTPILPPIEHYLEAGQYAGLTPHQLFWTHWYADQYLSETFGEPPWPHFVKCGEAGGCSPNPFFIPRWYRQQRRASQHHTNSLIDYINHLRKGSLPPDPNPLFDQHWYARTYFVNETTSFVHFLNGAARLPSCSFLANHPELRLAAQHFEVGYSQRFSSSFSSTPSALPKTAPPKPLEMTSAPRIAVCSVLTGHYDHIPQILHRDSETDYFLLTDQLPDGVTSDWQVIIVDSDDADPLHHSRALKMQLVHHLPNPDLYAAIVYIDSNIGLVGSLKPLLFQFLGSTAILGLIPHPFRRCVFEEAAAILIQSRDSKENVLRVVEFLDSAKHPPDAGLFEMNFFCFRPNNEADRFFSLWWSLYQRYGRRDQLLAPFVTRELGVSLHALLPPGQSIRTHPSFRFTPHRT